MTGHPEGRARTAGRPARPHRLRTVDAPATWLDLILAGTAIAFAITILCDPPVGPFDGRHLLMGAALAVLAIRAARR